MTRTEDLSDEIRVPLGNPADDKECRPRVVVCQLLQQAQRIGHDSLRELIPLGTVNVALKGRHLKVVFHINGERVLHLDR